MTSSFSEKLTKVKNALENVYVKKIDIINNLISTDTNKPLSANQGKVLNDNKEDKSNKISSWSATTTNVNYPSEKLVKDSLDNKVDKENGKGLFSGSYNDLTNKPNIPTKTSDLTNDGENGNNKYTTVTNITPTSTTDIDTYKTAGLYTFFNNTAVASMTSENKAKLPDGLGNNSFYLLVENKNAYAKQTLTQYSTGKTWIRIYNDNSGIKSWTSWAELSIEGHTHDDRYYTETEVDTALNDKSISIEKQSTADTGYTATYILKQGGTALSPKINIPKDYLVKSGTLETVGTTPTTLESTNNLTTGDKYLKFIVNTQENDDSTTLIIPVTDLIDTYTGDNTTIELNNGVFSVKPNTFADKIHTHSEYLTTHQDISGKANSADLATVAITGNYNDLNNTPTLPSASSTTPSADVSGGAIGNGATWARADHQHPLSSEYATSIHTHSINDVTNLQTSLNNKSNSNHNHSVIAGGITGTALVDDTDGEYVYAMNSKLIYDVGDTDKIYYDSEGTGVVEENELEVKGHSHTTWTSTTLNENATLYVNEAMHLCELKYTRSFSRATEYTNYSWATAIIPSDYRPAEDSYGAMSNGGTIYVTSDGDVKGYIDRTLETRFTLTGSVMWHY